MRNRAWRSSKALTKVQISVSLHADAVLIRLSLNLVPEKSTLLRVIDLNPLHFALQAPSTFSDSLRHLLKVFLLTCIPTFSQLVQKLPRLLTVDL